VHGTFMAAQISQFSKCIQRKMIKTFSEQNGGSARVLPGQSPSLTVTAPGSVAADRHRGRWS
jgi:hypothetical protein